MLGGGELAAALELGSATLLGFGGAAARWLRSGGATYIGWRRPALNSDTDGACRVEGKLGRGRKERGGGAEKEGAEEEERKARKGAGRRARAVAREKGGRLRLGRVGEQAS